MSKDNIAARIKTIRQKLGMNQSEFGELIGDAHKSVVSKWEKGQNHPNNARLKRIAEVGNISINELLYGTVEERAKEVLLEEVDNQGELFDSIIDFLSVSTDLGAQLTRHPRDEYSNLLSVDDSLKYYDDLKREAAERFINKELRNITSKIETTSIKTVDINRLDQEIINTAYDHIKQLRISQSFTIEGFYRRLMNSWSNIRVTTMGFEDMDALIERFKNEGYTDKAAYNKALEWFYHSKMEKVRSNSLNEVNTIWKEYQSKLKD